MALKPPNKTANHESTQTVLVRSAVELLVCAFADHSELGGASVQIAVKRIPKCAFNRKRQAGYRIAGSF
jgi:hypothetical protein